MSKRALQIIIPLLLLSALAQPAQAGVWSWLSPSRNWQRIKNGCSYCYNGVKGTCVKKIEKAKSDQRKLWGLKFADGKFDPGRPLAILIHGLDSDNGIWCEIAAGLKCDNTQVAYFSYPNDGPVDDAAKMLSDELEKLQKAHPTLRVHMIAHSMGALVARDYIESPRYHHEVDKFIAIAPPNHGSCWVRGRWFQEWHEHYWMWKTNPNWSPIWMLTDGTGQATDDLKPGSKFLEDLNNRPRRYGVQYTIILGRQHIASRLTADACASAEGCFSPNVWGTRQVHAAIGKIEGHYRAQTGDGDGVVSLESGRLDGVDDVIVLPADHNALAMSVSGKQPAALPAVKERIAMGSAK